MEEYLERPRRVDADFDTVYDILYYDSLINIVSKCQLVYLLNGMLLKLCVDVHFDA